MVNRKDRNIFNIMFSLFIVLNILTIFIGCFSYIFYLNSIQDLTDEKQSSLIEGSFTSLENGLNDIERVAAQIISLARKMDFPYSGNVRTPELIYEVYEFIYLNNLYADMSGFIDASYVYFTIPDILIAGSAMYSDQLKEEYPEPLKEILANPTSKNIWWQCDPAKGKMYYIRALETAKRNLGFLILEINQAKLLGYLETLISSNEAAFVLSFIPDNMILSELDPSSILTDELENEISLAETGRSIIRSDSEKYSIIKQDSINQNWTFTVIFSQWTLFRGLIPIFIIAGGTILLQLLFGLLISYIFSKYSYSPIKKLRDYITSSPLLKETSSDAEIINDLDFIERTAGKLFKEYKEMLDKNETDSQIIENDYITHILHGCRGLDFITDNRKILPFQQIAVMAIRIEQDSPALPSRTMQSLHIAVKMANDAISDIASKMYPGSKVVDYNMDTLVCIINSETINENDISSLAETIQSFLFNRLDMLTTIGISTTGEDPSQIYILGKEAFEAVNQGSITEIYSVNRYHVPEDSNRPVYSMADETIILNAVKTSDEQMIQKVLKESFDKNKEALKDNPLYAKMFLSSHINTLLRSCNTLKIPEAVISNEDIYSILDIKRVDNAFSQLQLLYTRISRYLNSNKKSHNEALFEKIMEYIRLHCFDSSLCLVSIADNFSINPTYLSVFLKEQLGETYINFITNMRLEKAQKILEETNMNIMDVATSVGYLSSGVFIRVFKKKFGISPGSYRDNLRKQG